MGYMDYRSMSSLTTFRVDHGDNFRTLVTMTEMSSSDTVIVTVALGDACVTVNGPAAMLATVVGDLLDQLTDVNNHLVAELMGVALSG